MGNGLPLEDFAHRALSRAWQEAEVLGIFLVPSPVPWLSFLVGLVTPFNPLKVKL